MVDQHGNQTKCVAKNSSKYSTDLQLGKLQLQSWIIQRVECALLFIVQYKWSTASSAAPSAPKVTPTVISQNQKIQLYKCFTTFQKNLLYNCTYATKFLLREVFLYVHMCTTIVLYSRVTALLSVKFQVSRELDLSMQALAVQLQLVAGSKTPPPPPPPTCILQTMQNKLYPRCKGQLSSRSPVGDSCRINPSLE